VAPRTTRGPPTTLGATRAKRITTGWLP
jgi:hypothetical protein